MSGNTQAVIQVFYCYAPADKYLLVGLEKQLAPLKHINAIAGWSDREVLAGTHRDQMVQSYLNYSDLILLLISPDSLAVDFCYSVEMVHALDRHTKGEAVILPIILRPIMWGITEIRHLQALPRNNKPVTTWSNRDAAFYDVAVGITEVVKKLIEKHHKRFVERYITDAESEARLNSSSWTPTDPFRAEKRADAEDLYKNIYDKLKSVQMEIIQQGIVLQQYIDSMDLDLDETDPEEGEQSIYAMEQAFVQETSSVSEEHESSSERRAQNESDRKGEVFTPAAGESPDQSVPAEKRETLRESTRPVPNLLLRGAHKRNLTLRPDDAIDLHMHTTYSDGRWPAQQLIDYLVSEHFDLVAITDHDRIDKMAEIHSLAAEKGLRVLSGVEMSTRWNGHMAHLLCYGFDPEQNDLRLITEKMQRQQLENTQEVNAELRRQGLEFPRQEEVLVENNGELRLPSDNIRLLVAHGYAADGRESLQRIEQAGFRLIMADMGETVAAAHRSGALCLIAHPGRREYGFTYYDPALLDSLRADIPIDGIEVYHPYHSQETINAYLEYVQKHDLLQSTGSDSHSIPGRMPRKHRAEVSRKLLERLGVTIT